MHTDKSIYVDIQNDLYFIDIDKIQFKQVIDNLITNAIKFSDKNNGKVIITANKGPKYYTVDIEDN
jgi:signal transduction histidine kinase